MKQLQEYIDAENIEIIETPLPISRLKGLYLNGDIYMDPSIETEKEYRCVLSEELGHHFTSDGNILDYKTIESQRQEDRAHRWAFEKVLPFDRFIDAYIHGCRNRYETAEYLNVTENYLEKAVKHYYDKHGDYIGYRGYAICFNPLGIMKKF